MSKRAATPRTRSRLGRPSGTAESLRRNRVVTMVTDSELKHLSAIAEAENQSLSATVHEMLARFLKGQQF